MKAKLNKIILYIILNIIVLVVVNNLIGIIIQNNNKLNIFSTNTNITLDYDIDPYVLNDDDINNVVTKLKIRRKLKSRKLTTINEINIYKDANLTYSKLALKCMNDGKDSHCYHYQIDSIGMIYKTNYLIKILKSNKSIDIGLSSNVISQSQLNSLIQLINTLYSIKTIKITNINLNNSTIDNKIKKIQWKRK